ncbi:MAG: NUDIX domain-containing protein [Tissierellia bacterium]|nr:NUDIX domain-containing protein [Tissierellia bacterium]
MREISAGGVVVFNNAILLLRKFNGDWVLPKGRLERGESPEEAAIREVFEESGTKGNILEYIDKVEYRYRNMKLGRIVQKEVYWYLMETRVMKARPQKSEGFIKAEFVYIDNVESIVRYEDERKIIRKAIEIHRRRGE